MHVLREHGVRRMVWNGVWEKGVWSGRRAHMV